MPTDHLSETDTVFPDFIAFLIGLSIAWFLNWQVTDLVWSLWLSSLVIGYVTILMTILTGYLLGQQISKMDDLSYKVSRGIHVGGAIISVFLLVFFSIHFCAFHAGHALFLSHFFPLEGVDRNVFNNSFMNPINLFSVVIQFVLDKYAFFLLPAIIAERRNIFKSVITYNNLKNRSSKSGESITEMIGLSPKEFSEMTKEKIEKMTPDKKAKIQKTLGDPFLAPYKNVIRMHLLIFFFAFAHFLNLESFLVYSIVYFVYFFPWRILRWGKA